MTKLQFYSILVRLCKVCGFSKTMLDVLPWSKVCESIAEHLWVFKIPENEDIIVLRAQLLELFNEGCFKFTDK